jgi:hypothetical protein
MITDRKGPGAPAQTKPPPLKQSDCLGRAWNFCDWVWDRRSLCWRAEWHHVSLPITSRDYGEYVAGTLNYRHWKTAATPVELIKLFFPEGWDDSPSSSSNPDRSSST